jgi:hypothetical protein
MTNSFTDRNTARKIANFIASDAPHNLSQGIPGWDCVDSPLHGNRDAERLDAPARYDCYYVKTEMDGSPVQSTLADLEASLAGDKNASIDTKVLKVVVLHWERQLPGCWRTFELLTLKDAIAEIKRTGRDSIIGRLHIWPNGSDKARSYVNNVIYEQTNPEGYAEMVAEIAPTPEYSSAEKLADARAAENKPTTEDVRAIMMARMSPKTKASGAVATNTTSQELSDKIVADHAFAARPTCNRCSGKLTQLDIAGSLSELGFDVYEAICGTCYDAHYC